MKIYISHSVKDKEFAKKLTKDLRDAGFDLFAYFDSISPGESISERIASAILESDAAIFILSKDSFESPWINSEIALARAQRERNKRSHIIPIVIDRAAEIPFFIKDLRYLDFSSEKNYNDNLPQLIDFLRKPKLQHIDKNHSQRARKKLMQAQETAMLLEKELFEKRRIIQQSFINSIFLIVTIASIVVTAVLLIGKLLIKLDWLGVLIATLTFFLGIMVSMLLSLHHRRHDLKKLMKLRERMEILIREIQRNGDMFE